MKRVVSLVLAALMLFVVMAGCGSSEQPKTTETPASAQASTSAAESVASEAPAKVTWDSPDLTWKKNTSPVKYSLFFDLAWSPVDVWGTDHVSQEVTKLTGVSFEATKGQDAKHLDLLLAGGDLPDAIFVWERKERFENSDVSQPWDELIPKYAPEFDSLIDPSEKALATVDDGHYYTLYTHVRNKAYWDDPAQPVSYGEPTIMLRDDIMAELGNPKIESADDFYNVLKQVKEKHPDYIPFLQPVWGGGALAGWFGVKTGSTTWFTDSNDKVKLSQADKEGYLPYLTYMNKLSRGGLISVEGLTYDFDKVKQAVLAGKVFAAGVQCFDIDGINEELDKVPGNKLRYTGMNKPLTVDGQVKYAPIYASPGFAGLYITKNCKDPSRLIALMEFMKSPDGDKLTQWGVKDLDYTTTADGLPLFKPEITWKQRGDNVWYFQATFLTEIMKVMTKKDTAPKYAQVTQLIKDFKPYYKPNFALAMIKIQAQTPESEIMSNVTNTFTNQVNAVILAADDAAFTKKYQDMFNEIDGLGVAQVEEFAQKQYDKVKARFQ